MSRQVRRSALRWAAGVVAGGLLAATGTAPALAAPSPLEPPPAARPHPHVTLAAPGRVPPAAQIAVTGQVGPAHPGRRLQLQARVAGHWRPVATTTLTRRSTYTFRRTLTATTTLRVVLPAHSDHRAGVSRVRAVRVVAAGFDVSYPQCGRPLPTGATAAVVGVDGGKPFDVNPCLAEQVAWASEASGTPAYYVNTANPGPRLSQFSPLGQAAPRACATSYPADDSTACASDYGWTAAETSSQRPASPSAVAGAPAVNRSTWWL